MAEAVSAQAHGGRGRGAHALVLGWRRRRRRGIKMEDEEVAESWEEAADSGVRTAPGRPRRKREHRGRNGGWRGGS